MRDDMSGGYGGVRRRRVGAGVTASLLAHAAVLGWLALNVVRAPKGAPPPQPELQVALVHPPTTAGADGPAHARLAFVAARPKLPLLPASPRSRAPEPSLTTSLPSPPPAPAAPSAPATSAGAAAPGRLPGAGGVDGGSGPVGSGVPGALRGLLGCSHAGALDLSPAERAKCSERLGLASRTAPRTDPIPSEKRAYYDAVAAAYAETHFYSTPRPTVMSRIETPDFKGPLHDWRDGVPPGHTANVGCSPLFLLPGYKPRPHSLKLGPCVVTPPRGTLTEEADIAAPPTLREREADAAHMRRLDPPKP